MSKSEKVLRPAIGLFYAVIVLEFLFMISPFALYFYSAYTPVLNLLRLSPATAWLTQFYLPHFSETTSPLLNQIHGLAFPIVGAGLLIFLAGAVPIYLGKLLRWGPITGGLYRFIRHPQYLGLAIVGVGTALIWPRFIVLVGLVTMLFLYLALALWEERECEAKYGDSYLAYKRQTGMLLPRTLEAGLARRLPSSRALRATIMASLYLLAVSGSVLLAGQVREYSLSHIAAVYRPDSVILSPALLGPEELERAYETALGDPAVQQRLAASGVAANGIVYVVPSGWYLPDLPLQPITGAGGHRTPSSFSRKRFDLLFSTARTWRQLTEGRDILRHAHGRDAHLLVSVDLVERRVLSVEDPPPYVLGDFPSPLY